MKNRRHFLVQTTLATTAMIALKPLTSIGNTLSQFTGVGRRHRTLAFVYTASSDREVIKYIQDIKSNNTNTILLHAGEDTQGKTASLGYDASINVSNDLSSIAGEYKIITKGNTRTGIITARPEENNVIQKVKALSTRLKKEKNCTIVVCLSQLGYQNKNNHDDITLAKESTDLDIIVGGHAQNFQKHPVVTLNRNNSEVIIHSASGNTSDCGKIEIAFDGQGKKHQVSFC